MNEVNEYDILLDIFRFIRDYSTDTYTLTAVCKKLIKHLADMGYTASLSNMDRDSKIVTVEGHKYKIIHWENWSKYDVVRTA